MSDGTPTLLTERPQKSSAIFVVSPRSFEFGWLWDIDLESACALLASKTRNTLPKVDWPEAWQGFCADIAKENIYPSDHIVCFTSNRHMGLRMASLLYSKRPMKLSFIGPDGFYSPRLLRGFMVAVVSGVFLYAWQRFLIAINSLTGGRTQRLYAIFMEYPQSLVWVSTLVNYSMSVTPRNSEATHQRKKVILINNALAPGGSERQFVNTLLGLKARPNVNVAAAFPRLFQFEKSDFYLPVIEGADIKLTTMNGSGRYSEEGDMDNAPLPGGLQFMPTNIREQFMFYANLFRRQQPDVVHLWQDETSLLGGLAAIAEGVPRIIMSSRNLAPYRFQYYRYYWRRLYRALAAHPSVLLVNNSQAGADDYVRWLGLPPSQFKVVRNGFLAPSEMKARREQHSRYLQLRYGDQNRITVGSIFRFWPEKDPMMWLRVARIIVHRLRRPNIDFVIAGDGPMREDMMRFIDRHGLSDRVKLIGVTTSTQDLLQTFDAFLLTSKVEGTPNVIIEAQAMGVPVITTTAGGAEETVNDGVTGWVVRTRTAQAIARKLIHVLDDAECLLQASSHAPQFVENRFGMERMISETLELYDLMPND